MLTCVDETNSTYIIVKELLDDMLKIIVNSVHIIFTLSIVVIVLLQSGKQAGLSGLVAGGAETFFGKNKGRTIDALLSKYTAVAAVGFLITSVWLQRLTTR